MKIAVLDWATMCCGNDLSPDIFNEFGDISVFPLTSPESATDAAENAEIILCNKVPITRAVIDKCPNLRYIGLFATGYNNVDVQYAAEKGIAVCNAGQYSTNAVAQQVFAYILDYCSRIREYNSLVHDGKWESSPCFSYFPVPISEIYGKTLSIVGYGSIGRRTAEIGNAFGMKIIVNTRTAPENCPYETANLKTAAEKADFLTFHCPLTEQTKGIVNSGLLAEMKPTAVLINTSRGAVVNEAHLANALNSGRIAAAYLDVLEKEPMSPDTPLKTARNCIITPHTAWAAYETRVSLLKIAADNIRAWINGSPKNKVN